jgi:AraC-like DNA-binding protein
MAGDVLALNATDFVARYIDAWNRRDAQAVADHLSDQGTYVDIPDHHLMSRQEWIVHLREIFSEENYVYQLVGEVCVGEGVIAFQYKAYLPGAEGEVDGEPWHGAEFITMRSSEAVDITDYYEQRGADTPGSPIANSTPVSRVRRYAKSGLDASQVEAVKNRVAVLMDEERIYLRSDLTLPQLASTLSCSVNHVSQAINAGFGMSFFDYLNQLRVSEATRLMQSEHGDMPTVLSIALQVGFNSTSTFYVAFKKVTGQTPAEYRRAVGAGAGS